MRDEIISGLKNAMERGESLENAGATFINAGYNPEEVRAAIQSISSGGGVSEIIKNSQIIPQSQQTNYKEKRSGKRILLIALLILMIILFLGAVGYLVYYFLGQK